MIAPLELKRIGQRPTREQVFCRPRRVRGKNSYRPKHLVVRRRPWTHRPDSVGASVVGLIGDYRADVQAIPRPMRIVAGLARSLWNLILGAVIGAALTLLVGLTIPTLFGYHNFIVLSGSMEPTIHVGDIVIDEEIPALRARIGDVVTFRDPANASKLITHRIRAIHVEGQTVHITTKGDASNGVQQWSVPADGHVGRVVTHLWRIGFLLFWVATKWGRIALVVVPALLLALYELRRIWRPKKVTDEVAA